MDDNQMKLIPESTMIKRFVWISIPNTVLYILIILFLIFVAGIMILNIQERNKIQHTIISNMERQQIALNSALYRVNPQRVVRLHQNREKIFFQQNYIHMIEKLQPKLSPTLSYLIAQILLSECDKKNLDPNLILAIIFVESSIDPMKESGKKACGLMQVRYEVWKEQPEMTDHGVDELKKLFWIEENIKVGTNIFLKFYNESENNINVTLYRYNSGAVKIPPNPDQEVLKYINKIMYYHYYIMTSIRGKNEASKGFNR
jgi:hypothetical protein